MSENNKYGFLKGDTVVEFGEYRNLETDYKVYHEIFEILGVSWEANLEPDCKSYRAVAFHDAPDMMIDFAVKLVTELIGKYESVSKVE